MSASRLIVVTTAGLLVAGCASGPGGLFDSGPAPSAGPAPMAMPTAPVSSSPMGPPPGPGANETAGTVIGAVGGAAVGSQIGGDTATRVTAAVAGAAIGGLLGNRIGAAMDDDDKQRAYQAQINALERSPPNTPVSWRNPDSGRYGSIVPGPAFDQRGQRCRSYTHTVYLDNRPETARGTACRNPNGSWTPVG
ncbi:MAG TPA: RT0821/Lpp0805 family surface protein [Xanthobacteraceae bacterium]|nr:RT0821/Lpp0805 family surface protein [Xanthobacteraceae bacterium]